MTDPTRTGAAGCRLTRRRVLAGGATMVASVAGCVSGDGANESDDGENNASQTDEEDPPPIDEADVPTTPRVEDPPAVVYTPTHTNSVGTVDPVRAGDFRLLPHFTSPHRFWLVRGEDVEEVEPSARGLHLMIAVWDAETGAMLPVSVGQTLALRRDGDLVEPLQLWPMLSQEMGFHFGDNVPFPEFGTYTIEIRLGPIEARKTGAFAGRFEKQVSATVEFEFTEAVQQEAVQGVEYLDESEWGEPGAVPPISHGELSRGTNDDDEGSGLVATHPGVALPPADSYPGRDLGVHESHDAQFVVRYFEESRLADGGGYLLVSPRTPYNRVPLPDMALTAEGAVEGTFEQTLDSDLGHHYGLAATLAPGDRFDVVVQTPPQVARHQGYEIAFREMEPMTVEVSQQ
jgi:hypothetical protein